MAARNRFKSDDDTEKPISECSIVGLRDCDGSLVPAFVDRLDDTVMIRPFPYLSGTAMRGSVDQLVAGWKKVRVLLYLSREPIEVPLPPTRYRVPSGVFFA